MGRSPRFVPPSIALLFRSLDGFSRLGKAFTISRKILREIPARFTKRRLRGLSSCTPSKSKTGKKNTGKIRGRDEPIDSSRDSSRRVGAARPRRGDHLYHR